MKPGSGHKGYPIRPSVGGIARHGNWRDTPPSIQQGIYDILKPGYARAAQRYKNIHFIFEAAARCLTEEEHCRQFFRAAAEYAEVNPGRNMAQAVNRLLRYHSPAKKALEETTAYSFVEAAIKIVSEELENENVKTRFFVGAELFLNALKQRANNHDFMDREKSDVARRFYEDMTNHLEEAAHIVRTTYHDWKKRDKIQNLLTEIKKYMDYKGTPGVIEAIAEEAGK